MLWALPGWAEEGTPTDEVLKTKPDQKTADAAEPAVETAIKTLADDSAARSPAGIPGRASPTGEAAPAKNAPTSMGSLTAAERAILGKGLYSNGEIYGTAFIGFAIGFGTGHMIQGRYAEKGWVATGGTLAGLLIMIAAPRFETVLLGLAICTGTRVWEIRDLVNTSQEHNRRYRALRGTSFVGLLPMTDGEVHALAFTMTF